MRYPTLKTITQTKLATQENSLKNLGHRLKNFMRFSHVYMVFTWLVPKLFHLLREVFCFHKLYEYDCQLK